MTPAQQSAVIEHIRSTYKKAIIERRILYGVHYTLTYPDFTAHLSKHFGYGGPTYSLRVVVGVNAARLSGAAVDHLYEELDKYDDIRVAEAGKAQEEAVLSCLGIPTTP